MKIDSSSKSVPGPTQIAPDSGRVAPGAGRNAPGPRAPQVAPRGAADESGYTSEIRSTLGEMTVADAAKINEIKQAIADGRFTVNASVVADRLVKTALELLRAQMV